MADFKALLGEAYREDMSAGDLLAALNGIDLTQTEEFTRLRDSVSNANAEAAKYKKELKSKMTEEEAAKAKQQEIMDKLAALQKDNSRMKQEKLLIAAGYDPETALKLAGYIVDGDAEAFVKAQTAWLAEQRKAIYAQTKEELLKSTPALNMGGGKDETPPDVAFAKARAKERAAQTEAANKARQIYFK